MSFLAGLLACGLAAAQSTFDARGFWVADTSGDAHRPVRLAYPDAGGGWDAGVLVDTARTPLVEVQPGGAEPVVDLMASAHAFAGVGIRGLRFEAAAPVTLYGRDQQGGFAAAGDVRIGLMAPAWSPRRGWPGVGLQVSAWLPTGAADRWSGSPGPAAGAVVAMGQQLNGVGPGSWGWVGNAGFRAARSTEARNLQAGPGPIGGLDAHLEVFPGWVLGAGIVTQGATGFESWPLEWDARLRHRRRGGAFAVLGVAGGIGDGVGASGGRVYLGMGFGTRPAAAPQPVVVPVVLTPAAGEARPSVTVVQAVLEGDRIVVAEQVFFEEDQAAVLPGAEPVLAAVAEILAEHTDIHHLLIEGHTNSRGSQRYNRNLSEARAEAVVGWLASHGVDADRLLSKGFGEERPLVPDSDPDAMLVNRRVEFIVLRSDEQESGGSSGPQEGLPGPGGSSGP